MRYYKIQTKTNEKIIQAIADEKKSRSKNKRSEDEVIEIFAEAIRKKDEDILEMAGQKYFANFCGIDARRMCLIMVVRDDTDTDDEIGSYVREYLSQQELSEDGIEIEEITSRRYSSLLHDAYMADFVKDNDALLEKYELNKLGGFHNSFHYDEYIVPDDLSMQKDIVKKAKEMLTADALTDEIDKIFMVTRPQYMPGHPVHYALSVDEDEEAAAYIGLLLRSLKLAGRIASSRYTKIAYSKLCEDYSHRKLTELYRLAGGGTVVIAVDRETAQNSNFLTGRHSRADDLCKIVMQHKNDVLTIFTFPRESESLKEKFFSAMDDISMVDIDEHVLFADAARVYLKAMTGKFRISGNKALYGQLEQDKGYTKADLRRMFEKWFNAHLRNNIYTQYRADVKVMNAAGRKARGSAIAELDELIGLTETKKLVSNIIDFAQAQKLYDFPGKRKSQALHMIFTGNPGSAKTTVARLVAQIFKENQVLETGDLIEVGRSDLVGQYVGWTAMQVKKAFRRAQDSVLFIDEAYSLVDGSNSFGDEAINTIVQEMENHREHTVVILAGYPDKMEGFLNKNPGLRSRISFHVNFPDYTPEELYSILELQAKNDLLKIGCGARERIMPILKKAAKVPEFGNGRYARNLLEQAQMRQATRLMHLESGTVTEEIAATLIAEDFEEVRLKAGANAAKQIGF
jgi:Holliday junction resolvasome RuvABC ATP-dependent DNA helicase subunit